MITSLVVKNFVLVDHAEVEFKAGLNIITGETGAGKSILINALAQLCGERSSLELVKTGEKKAVIEAHVSVEDRPGIGSVLAALEIDDEFRDLIIRKEINSNGTTRIFLNDTPVTLSGLNTLSTLLFDLHGQHQHQRLLYPETHLDYLDDYGDLFTARQRFESVYADYNKALGIRQELVAKRAEVLRMRDLYRFQIQELEKAELDTEELERIRRELQILSNIEVLHQDGAMLAELLYTGDTNAGQLLVRAEHHLQNMGLYDAQFREMLEHLRSAREAIEEIGRFGEQYVAGLEFDPERAEYIRQRLAHVDFLQKKYQKKTVDELVRFLEELQQAMGDSDQYEKRIEAAETEIKKLAENLQGAGDLLSEKRRESAGTFEREITKAMRELGMPDARFRVDISPNGRQEGMFIQNGVPVSARPDGFDVVLFEVCLNAGEPFRPLNKTASGGEISRIMLALKSVLAGKDRTPVLIFDEIDSGISGKVAQIIGRKMSELSGFHQILCVTHLPQIAAFADVHFRVAKYTQNGHTSVQVEHLKADQREIEVAYLLGGEKVTRQAIENARQLLEEANYQKK